MKNLTRKLNLGPKKISLLLLFFCFCFGAFAQGSIVMKMAGIKGECTQEKYKEWINVHSVGFDFENQAGKTTKGQLELVRPLDIASPLLLGKLNSQEVVRNVTIVYFRDNEGHGKSTELIKVVLDNVKISRYSTSFAEDNEQHHESLTLDYESIRYTVTSRNSKDGQPAEKKSTDWNFRTNSRQR